MSKLLVGVTGAACSNVVSIESASMCPIYSINALTVFLKKYYWLFGSLLMLVGLFLTFLGRKLFIFTVFIIGVALTVFLIMIVFYTTFLKSSTAVWIGWTVLGASIVVGFGIGFLCTIFLRVSGAATASYGGFMLGVLINDSWLYIYHSSALFWCITIGFAIAFFIVAFIFFNQVVIISTSLIGSYFVMRGISALVDKDQFPPAFHLIEMVK